MPEPPPSNTTRLYLIRHGATAANESRPYVLQGQNSDHSLSDVGRQQASQVGQFLSRFPLKHVYTSPLRRALETAQQIADQHNLPVQEVEDIVEVDVGEWEQMDWDTIMRKHPEEYRRFVDNSAEYGYRGGESYLDVAKRTQPAIQGLLKQHPGESIAVVGHNVVNRAYLAGLMGLELRRARYLQQKNACINVIRYRDGQSTLLTLNSHFHIEETL